MMKFLLHTVLLIATVVIFGCDKNREQTDVQPVAFFKTSPISGNTTTVFRFNSDSVISQGTRNNPVLVRWDWESDGIWDRMYSTGNEITHRFFKAGSYRIIMEASTLTGKRDTMVTSIEIVQGYSAPRALFSMTPDSANIKSEFTFDASLSKDDEDSLDQLEFRWDFNGDLQWDSEYSHIPVIKHRYSDNYNYPVRLEIRDPQNMTSIKTDTLVVTRLNDRIVPVVTHECWPCTIEDTVRFNAGGSYSIDKPDAHLLYSWDLFDDNVWELSLSESPHYKTIIGLTGKPHVRVRVTDEEGLYMDFIETIELFPWNSPPVIKLVLGNRIGNTGTNFYLHIRGSSDHDDSYLDLKSRWDINSDGIWDSEYDGKFEILVNYSATGKHLVTVMLTDPKDKSSMATDTVWVVEGNHETGLLQDRREGFLPTYYGTIKVGNRWWMQSNLKFYSKVVDVEWMCDWYNNNPNMAERYGALYPPKAIHSRKPYPCPDGWHVPSLAEWQALMTDLGQDATVERLMEGGLSEFHVVLAGEKDYDTDMAGQKDQFSGLGKIANFWTSTTNTTGQVYAWYVDPIRKQNRAVVVGKNYWFPIRCIKDE